MFSHETLVEAALGAATSPGEHPHARPKSQTLSPVAVNQKVPRLGVTVDDVDGVNVLETVRGLINKKTGNERQRVAVGIGSGWGVPSDWPTLRRSEPTITCR